MDKAAKVFGWAYNVNGTFEYTADNFNGRERASK
jgi:hypothetical protein